MDNIKESLQLAIKSFEESGMDDLRSRMEKVLEELEKNTYINLPSKYHLEYLDSFNTKDFRSGNYKSICKMFGVRYLMVGELKVKDTSDLIYKGGIFPVIGYYMKWPVIGHHSDGRDEYRISLVGKGFEWLESTISTGDIEWIKAEKWEPSDD